MKILLFDIETMANLGYIWGKYEQNVISFKEHWYIISFAYKWLGDKRVKAYCLPDFKLYKKEPHNDLAISKTLWKLFDEADVVVAHNGNAFDVKKVQAKFVQHHFKPPTPFKQIDTKLVARRYFKFDSNKLDDLGQYLGVGRKMVTEGWALWERCEAGDMKAWRKMVKYNKRDVCLLEKVYIALRPWMDQHPNLNLVNDTFKQCPKCGGDLMKQGTRWTRVAKYQQYTCKSCGGWCHGQAIPLEREVVR